MQQPTFNPISTANIQSSFLTNFSRIQNQFSQFLTIFESFVNSNNKKQHERPRNNYEVQVRDREVIVPLPKLASQTNQKINKNDLKKWIADIFTTVFSTAFHYYFKNEMTIEQAKIFCSENIIKNIITLNQTYSLSQDELHTIDQHIKERVIGYLRKKYPFSESTEINKRLQRTIREVDNLQALQNNYLTKSQVKFQYRESGDYSDLIMRVINELMRMIDKQKKQNLSNFKQFEDLMSSVFEKVQDEDWMKGLSVQDAMGKRSKNSSKEKYKEKVKEYTIYAIGRKIPQNTSLYTSSQIENGTIKIDNSTILRILTKWCVQLQQKYSGNYYSTRSQSLKLQRGNIKILLSSQKKAIDQRLRIEKQLISTFMSDIFNNNYELQSKILKNEADQKQNEFIDHIQKASGKFSCKVVKNLHAYTITYLNRLIHGLLKVAVNACQQEEFQQQDGEWTSPPNLLSFTIGDLIRCKCSSKQAQIIKLYEQIQNGSRTNPDKFKIIRVKNRLKLQTNDILINVRFNNQITCQIQLAIKSKASDFNKCSNSFQHYLYELQRSIFGPLTELCSIWSSLDRRTEIYRELVSQEQVSKKQKKYKCDPTKMQVYSKPFVCSCCGYSYFHNHYLLPHKKCAFNNCSYILCSHCHIESLTQEQLQAAFIDRISLSQACKSRVIQTQDIPDFGVCVLIETKQPKLQIFSLLEHQGEKYLLGQKDNKIYQICKINSKISQRVFRKKYIIFRAEESNRFRRIQLKRGLYEYIIPLKMKESYRKYKENISLMDLNINTEQCRKILSNGTKIQKQAVKNIFLADNELDKLPLNPFQFPNINWINITSTNIKSFKNISQLNYLKRLKGSKCNIFIIDPQIFKSKSLQIINFSQNCIQSIQNQIKQLTQLQHLDLQDNRISILPEGLFSCTKLRVLNLSRNKLEKVPQGIGFFSILQTMNFGSNLLVQISQKIGALQNLKELFLKQNQNLQVLPSSIEKLTKLQQIDISNTGIQTMPNAHWSYLKAINIQNTRITSLTKDHLSSPLISTLFMNNASHLQFPENFNYGNIDQVSVSQIDFNNKDNWLVKMLNLQRLKIRSKLDWLPERLKEFSRLEELDISYCEISRVPNITLCKHILSLDLSHNLLSSLPRYFFKGFHLQHFKCSNNQLTQLPQGMLYQQKLRLVDLSHNQFTDLFSIQNVKKIQQDSIGWPCLKFIDLAYNSLTDIPLIVCNSKAINRLILNNNCIESIRSQIKELESLNNLYLSNNLLKDIPSGLQNLPLKKLLLDYNNITHIPCFVSKMPLKVFIVDPYKIKTVECMNWVLKDSLKLGIDIGELRQVVKK